MTAQTNFPRPAALSAAQFHPLNRTVHPATVKTVSPFRASFRRPVSWNFARPASTVNEANSSKSNQAESNNLPDYSMAA